MQDVAFGDFTLTEREALFEDVSHSIEVKSHHFKLLLIVFVCCSLFGKMGWMTKVTSWKTYVM